MEYLNEEEGKEYVEKIKSNYEFTKFQIKTKKKKVS